MLPPTALALQQDRPTAARTVSLTQAPRMRQDLLAQTAAAPSLANLELTPPSSNEGIMQ